MLWDETSKVQGYRWIDILSTFVTAYNKAPHAAHNKSPYEAFFGFKMRGVYSTPGIGSINNMPITIAQEEDDNDQVENINGEIIRNDEDNDQIENINSTETTVYKAHIMQVEKVRKEIAQNDE